MVEDTHKLGEEVINEAVEVEEMVVEVEAMCNQAQKRSSRE